MKVKIYSDVFGIVDRLRDIDSDYFIVYDLYKNVFEIHNYKNTINTYSMTLPYNTLDNRTIDIVQKYSISNIENIIKDIDEDNKKLQNKIHSDTKDYVDYVSKDIYRYAQNTSKEYRADMSYKIDWI